MTTHQWGLSHGPATYVGLLERQSLPCRIVRFRKVSVVVRWADGTTDTVHPDNLRQDPA